MYVSYTAKRNLRSGVSSGSTQSFEVDIEADVERSKANMKVVESLGLARQSVVHSVQQLHTITTVPTDDTALHAEIEEFLYSCIAAEDFTIDIYGTTATEVDRTTARLDNANFSSGDVLRGIFKKYTFTIVI